MAEAAKTRVDDEVVVIQMDTAAFLAARYKIRPYRKGKLISDNGKKIAFWAYRKTTEVEHAIAEWTGRQKLSTKIILEFREEQLIFRHEKAKLERGE